MEQRMYWKDGFYDEPIEGSVEITEEYYQELLTGQSAGKMIVEDEKRFPVLAEYEYGIEDVQKMKISEIQRYDTSDAVNSFTMGSKHMWLDKSTRVGLMNSICIERESGRGTTSLWFSGVQFTIPVAMAIQMLNALELYALECYNVTQAHIAAVNALTEIEEVNLYDYKTGYPDKLVFNL